MEGAFWQDIYQWYANHIVLGRILIFGVLVAFSAIFRRTISVLISRFLFRLLPKEYFKIQENLFKISLLSPLKLLFQLLVIHVGFRLIVLPKNWQGGETEKFWVGVIAVGIYKIALIGAFTWLLVRVMDFLSSVYLERNLERQTKMSNQLIPFMRELFKILILILSFFVMLGSVFEVNVPSIIAGLGIGGLAVALAGKETIENLFASFTIFIDQPFVVGDFVQVGTVKGIIEKVGFRSTRLRTLEKTYVTIPNKKMVDDTLENISQRSYFRVSFPIYLDKDNSSAQLDLFVKKACAVVSAQKNISQEPRIYFNEFADGILKVNVLYWIDTVDDWEMNETKQKIALKFLELVQAMELKLSERPR